MTLLMTCIRAQFFSQSISTASWRRACRVETQHCARSTQRLESARAALTFLRDRVTYAGRRILITGLSFVTAFSYISVNECNFSNVCERERRDLTISVKFGCIFPDSLMLELSFSKNLEKIENSRRNSTLQEESQSRISSTARVLMSYRIRSVGTNDTSYKAALFAGTQHVRLTVTVYNFIQEFVSKLIFA